MTATVYFRSECGNWPDLTPEEVAKFAARDLYDALKRDIESAWANIVEIYNTKAWLALGYANFTESCQAEFNISKSRAYQILDQGRITLALREAADSTDVELTEAMARDLKPILPAVVERVREAVAGVPEEQRPEIVAAIVDAERRGENLVVADIYGQVGPVLRLENALRIADRATRFLDKDDTDDIRPTAAEAVELEAALIKIIDRLRRAHSQLFPQFGLRAVDEPS